MKTHVAALIGGVLIGMALLTATSGPLAAQEPAEASGSSPLSVVHAATPKATHAHEADAMERMMEQCANMMGMMGMMGGDMSGMMGGEGMQGMEGLEDMPSVSATPGP